MSGIVKKKRKKKEDMSFLSLKFKPNQNSNKINKENNKQTINLRDSRI